jgi:hypothetical protein
MCHHDAMRTTFDLDGPSYRLAKAVAAQRGLSMGKIVAEAIQNHYGSRGAFAPEIGRSEAGFPVLSVGHSVTSDDVSSLDDE